MVYIKSITITGFKSYLPPTTLTSLSPKHNVIVGRNGSGKSNFFSAIRFVLGDAYTNISKEERSSLLHEGVGVGTGVVLSAWVEIVFDNADGRFPTGNPTLTLRRTIGSKKDEYTLDRRSASKADVLALLESAGFSRSNPYYIVPQGRITSLTNAKDAERLNLLKEVAGTKVYENRRSESMKLMEETETKRGKIGELVGFIEGRLAELEEEKEELREWSEADKERRCLEYALFSGELEELVAALDEIEEERKTSLHASHVRQNEYTTRATQITTLTNDINSAKQELSLKTLEKKGISSEVHELTKARTELQCVVADLEKATEASGEKQEEIEKELRGVEKKIKSVERELAKVEGRWKEGKESLVAERKLLELAQNRLSSLYSKQQHISQFRTKAERDAFLRKEIGGLKAYERTQESLLGTVKQQIEDGLVKKAALERRGQDLLNQMEDRRTLIKTLTTQLNELSEKKSVLSESMKEKWREDAKLESSVGYAREMLRTAERDLGSMVDKDTGSGLRAIDRIVAKHGLEGVYGPLYRLLEVPDKSYATAIESTAGNSLFHVVVDTEVTAKKVLDIMLKEKTGRVTFMPLNRLHPKAPTFPTNTSDAIPLISKIKFDEKYKKAFQQVFGKTAVCKDLAVAAACSRSHGLNTITLDGDKVERKGAMSGGWVDSRRSRLEAVKNVAKWGEVFKKDDAALQEGKQEMSRIDQESTKLNGQMQILEGQKGQATASREPLLAEAANADKELSALNERLERLESEAEAIEADMGQLRTKMEGYEKTIGSAMEAGLSSAEEQLIAALGKEVDERKSQLGQLSGEKNEIESKKNLLEIELNESLRRKREELKTKLDNLNIGSAGGEEASSVEDLEARKRELKTLNGNIDDLKKQDHAMEKAIETLNSKIQTMRADLEKAQAQQVEDSRGISKQQKNTERYLAKKQLITTRKEECNRNIRDLGVLPEEAFEKYTNQKMDKILKKLNKVNESLKKYSHVNKKAFEQYNNFTKQRDQLLERREDLDKSATSIQDLIEVLDQRKDEAIERTFKEVAKNFEEVFEKLVPAGRGKLIIQRRIDRDEEPPEDPDEEGTPKDSVENYTGVSIKVSFNSKVDEGLRIQQLSGGQKSLVALATVFAIQKCDPAPFYLFDEIDANLDAQYRTAVASMIHELSESAQFITTTFRPEMLPQADKFYGVTFNNQKVSSIGVITRDGAQQFVDTEMQAQ